MLSKALYDNKNSIEYDPNFKAFWLKSAGQFLFMVDKPYFNYSIRNLYLSIQKVYCRHYTPKIDDVIIDVGAGIGTELIFFWENIGEHGKIYSIEASPTSYRKLNELCIKNKIYNSLNFNLAISDTNGKIWMEETDRFEANQVNKEAKGMEINSLTLDKFIEDNGIENVDFLKVNIEGAELHMIQGMSQSIKKVNNIAVSCHDFLNKEKISIRKSMIDFLKGNNFEIHENNTGNIVLDSWIYGTRK